MSTHRHVAVALALLLGLSAGCEPGSAPPGRVLIVGIDGATLRVVAPMIERGELPHLAALAEAGVSGPLRSMVPLESPRIWNSVATGKTPEKHGILSFAHETADGQRKLYLSTDRRVHALWNIASSAGYRVGVVNWWNTYPPERVDGVMISDHVLAKEIENRTVIGAASTVPDGPLTYPPDWQPRVAELLANPSTLPDGFSDPFAGNERLARWHRVKADALSQRFEEDAAITALAREVDGAIRPDLLMVLLPGIDRVSHFLWGNMEPPEAYPPPLRPDEAERRAGVEALEGYYAYTDALIGELLQGFGPEDLVVVLSDHGFEAGQAMMLLTGVHEGEEALDGLIFARGPGLPPGSSSEGMTVLDVAPTVLAWLGLPPAEDMDGRVLPRLDRTHPAPVPTYDIGAVERLPLAPSGGEEALLEQLRELGYVE